MTELLIQKLKKNERKSQKILYEQYSRKMYKVCYKFVINEQDAASIVNSGFYKIFSNIKKFVYNDLKSFEVWMQKIIVNEALLFLRNKITFVELKNDYENNDDFLFEEEKYLSYELCIRLLSQLEIGHRTVFNLYAIEGYSHKEIAEKLNITESTSRSQLSRARTKLKNLINELVK